MNQIYVMLEIRNSLSTHFTNRTFRLWFFGLFCLDQLHLLFLKLPLANRTLAFFRGAVPSEIIPPLKNSSADWARETVGRGGMLGALVAQVRVSADKRPTASFANNGLSHGSFPISFWSRCQTFFLHFWFLLSSKLRFLCFLFWVGWMSLFHMGEENILPGEIPSASRLIALVSNS